MSRPSNATLFSHAHSKLPISFSGIQTQFQMNSQPMKMFVLSPSSEMPQPTQQSNATQDVSVPQASTLSHRCQLCPMAFTKESGLKRHTSRIHRQKSPPRHHQPESFNCSICHIPFNSALDVKYHMDAQHHGYATQVQKCTDCGCFRQFTPHCMPNPFRCESCSFHIQKLTHAANSNGNQINYQVLSSFDDSAARHAQQSQQSSQHRSMKLGQSTSSSPSRPVKAHKCPDCPKSFAHATTLSLHQKTHTGEYKDICEYCDKTFVLHDYYIRHLRVHTKEKPYQCDVCDKSFSQSNTLTQHKRTHTGEKPYKCDECGRSFGVRDYLNKHKRIHTGEKPYNCEVCGKKYTQPSALASHKKQHSHYSPSSPEFIG